MRISVGYLYNLNNILHTYYAAINKGKTVEQDAKAVEISWGAPNYRIDLSRYVYRSSPYCEAIWRRYCYV